MPFFTFNQNNSGGALRADQYWEAGDTDDAANPERFGNALIVVGILGCLILAALYFAFFA